MKQNKGFFPIIVIADLFALTLSFLASYGFRFSLGLIPMAGDAPAFEKYAQALIIVLPVFFFLFRSYGLYDPHRRIRRIEEIFQVIKASSIAIVLLMAITFFYRGFSYSRIFLCVLWLFSFTFVSASRYFAIQFEYKRKQQKKELTKVLLIGANRSTRQVIQWATNNPHYGQEVIGVLAQDEELIGKHVEGVPILGVMSQCEKLIESQEINQVVLLENSFERQKITELMVYCEDRMIEFKVIADVYGLMSRHVNVEYISSVPLLGFKALPLDDLWNRAIKRTFDILVASICLAIASPFFIIIWILIKIDDKGPLFYSQERVGRDYRTFNVLKFRTMRVNAEDETGPVWAKEDDDRRTLAGNFLRKWNLDELPQLLNVLRGEMSMVGPRPERPHFVDQFRETIPRYMARHKIKSGLTGWAAVNGFRGNTSIQERVKYDLYYMENWSLLLDIEILFMTFSAKSFKNAY